tara:strand:+ start:249 stop:833 length:585 start_codon:yes stop_codon:yes gene_type:complete
MTTTITKKKTTTTKSTSLELPKNPFVFEVLDLASKQRSKAKKIEVLKKYRDNGLVAVLIWNFDETITSLLPEGEVPYSGFEDQTKSNGGLTTKITEEVRRMHETDSFSMGSSDKNGHTTIRREFKNFYHFLKGGNPGLSAIRRETMFINILEGLHPLEAEIICLVKDKKLTDKYKITKEIVSEAYPDITWGGRG